MPFLSVIIPVYNSEAYIEELMESILKQKIQKYEVILVDDGSQDHSLEICRKYEENYDYVRVIHTENRGVSHARNVGISMARGEWIHFVDSDDKLSHGMFQHFYETIKKHNIDLVVCGCVRERILTHEREICGPKSSSIYRANEIVDIFQKLEMEKRYWLLDYIWNKWYKRDIIQKRGLHFDESLSLGEDFVFNTQYFQYISSFAVLKETYYYYLIRESGLVSKFRAEPWIGRQQLFERQKELYQKMGILDSNIEWLRVQAGQISFGDLRTINSPSCKYKYREKQRFVKNMMESEQFSLIKSYLRKRKGMAFQAYKIVWNFKWPQLTLLLIQLEKIKR